MTVQQVQFLQIYLKLTLLAYFQLITQEHLAHALLSVVAHTTQQLTTQTLQSIPVTDAGGDDYQYNSATGAFTYTGPMLKY